MTRSTTARTPVQLAAAGVGAVFLLVGVLGFVPGITTNLSAISLFGHMSGTALLGIFEVSVLHNLVHLLFGVAGLALARSASTARSYLLIGGIIYAVLFVYGLVIDLDSAANFVPLNTADNYLHLLLAVLMIGLGIALGRGSAVRAGGRGRR